MAAEHQHHTGSIGDQAPLPSDAPDDAIFVCRELRYSYLDRFPALDDVSIDIRAGEMVALLGANGCGKSTLLKILDGLVHPDSGTFHAFGHLVTEDNLEDEQFSMGFRSRVGFVFQNSDAQVFSPTVREEVGFGCLQLGLSVAETKERVADVLAMLAITDLADRAPFQLSGGQKKKVAIASVLVMNPDVLLFDEPTAALDPRSQTWLAELIADLNQAGKTIVYATHDLAVLQQIATRCVVFSEDHRLVRSGPPAEVLADTELLQAVNLVHEHVHTHDEGVPVVVHSHPHPIHGDHHR
ncbi:energy-coupling factor ABC transporter ATP-binding protein [Kribbella sp. NBC_00709]|uniref:energy-coupling factor ABC transporter ATP-binding protein n=1 Tax=Kribbella sp. NBC_00709 TaxID=2975972 RepID=UPI002E2BD451|nr:ABC transporter ATP-binding protein [Kribbella sp. NBC_00709]